MFNIIIHKGALLMLVLMFKCIGRTEKGGGGIYFFTFDTPTVAGGVVF